MPMTQVAALMSVFFNVLGTKCSIGSSSDMLLALVPTPFFSLCPSFLTSLEYHHVPSHLLADWGVEGCLSPMALALCTGV